VVGTIGALGGSDCELLRSGWLAQPANTISAAAFVVVAARLAWLTRRPGFHRPALAAAAAALAAVGVGSIAYHGPGPGWAHAAHDGSIAALAVVETVLVVAARAQGRVTQAARTAWKQAAVLMAVAGAAFVSGRTGAWLCHPSSPLQLHAVWHVASAVALSLVAVGGAQAPAEKGAVWP